MRDRYTTWMGVSALVATSLTIMGCSDEASVPHGPGPLPAGASAPSGPAPAGGPATSGGAATGGATSAAPSPMSAGQDPGVAATAGTPAAADPGAAGASGAAPAADGGEPAGPADAPTAPTCEITIPSSMDCSAKLAPGDVRNCTLGSREYIVYVGKTMNPCEPVGLVIDAHGASETAAQQYGTDEFCASGGICWHGIGSGWAAEADAQGFIAVFPQGIMNRWSASDADFMLELVDEMKTLADIDPKKIYMSGISNGGFLTFQTGCPHSDVFKGMAPVAGGTTCSSINTPIPLITFAAAPDFAYDSAVGATDSVVEAMNCQGEAKPWLTIDSNYPETVCRTAKQDTMATLVPCNMVTSTMIEPTECKIWDQCDGGAKVVFCEVAPNTEHGAENAALDAHILYENNTLLNMPSVAWRFFKEFW